jgi:hypothetical protein
MALDLSSIMNKSADDVKRPIPFNDGLYYGIIKGYQVIESPNKKTPGCELTVGFTHAHPETDLTGYDEKGEAVQLDPTDKEFRYTFWLSDAALFMLIEFAQSLGIDTNGRSIGEIIPMLVSQPVLASLAKAPRKPPQEGFYNNIEKLTKAA